MPGSLAAVWLSAANRRQRIPRWESHCANSASSPHSCHLGGDRRHVGRLAHIHFHISAARRPRRAPMSPGTGICLKDRSTTKSSANRGMTCHGLRTPARRAALTLTRVTLLASGPLKPVAQCDVDKYGAQYLHLRYGRSSAIPLASRNSLPPYVPKFCSGPGVSLWPGRIVRLILQQLILAHSWNSPSWLCGPE